jgi:hypothetical protein
MGRVRIASRLTGRGSRRTLMASHVCVASVRRSELAIDMLVRGVAWAALAFVVLWSAARAPSSLKMKGDPVMMVKVRTAIAILLGISALSAVTAGSAYAGWFVEGEELSSTAALATTAKVDQASVLKSTGAGVELECNGSALDGISPEIVTTNEIRSSSLEFTGCKALTAHCTLSSTEIHSVPVVAELTQQAAPAAIATFKPKTKSLLATFEFEGGSCASAGVNGVTGAAKAKLPTGQEEQVAQAFNFLATEASGELKVAGSAASLTGSSLFKLATGKLWRFIGAPAVGVDRVSGNGAFVDECTFVNNNERCVIKVTALASAGRPLILLKATIVAKNAGEERKFGYVIPAEHLPMGLPECLIKEVYPAKKACGLEIANEGEKWEGIVEVQMEEETTGTKTPIEKLYLKS